MAFLADVSLVLFVGLFALILGRLTGRPILVFVALFLLWIYYLSASVWLTEGETAGKAACALQLRRWDGSRPGRSARSFLWSFGRHSFGYLIVDVLGLGVLLAAVTRRRRCLHDVAFGSLVVQTQVVVVPKGFWSRYGAFWERFEKLYEAAKLEHRRFLIPWKYLSKALAVIVAALSMPLLFDAMRSSAAATEVLPAAPTTPVGASLTPLQVAGMWAATTAASSVVVISVIAAPTEAFNPTGSWVLVNTEVTVDNAIDHPEFEGQVLVIEARDDDSFVITQGPDRLVGTAFDPKRNRNAEAFASSSEAYRSNCVEVVTRELVAEHVYSGIERWEFFIDESLSSQSEGLEQFAFRYSRTSVKDRHPPEAVTCPETVMVEITATAIRNDQLD